MRKRILLLPLLTGFLASCSPAQPEHTHTFDETKWSQDSTQHWHAATCGHDVKDAIGAHIDIDGNHYCDVCLYKMSDEPVHEHTFSSMWSTNDIEHWHAATCGHDVVSSKGTHADTNNDGKCDVCNYEMPSPVIIHVESVSLNVEQLDLVKGKTFDLIATVLPENATDKTVIWESSNSDVAKVNNGKITGISAGNCEISVTTNDLHLTKICEVVVTEEVKPDPVQEKELTYEVKENGESQIQGLTTITKDFLTFTFAKNEGANAPMYNYKSSGKHGMFRLYPKNTMTISSTKPLKKLEITFFDNEIDITADKGTLTDNIWTGKESSITFTAGGTSGHVDFEVLKFTYEDKEVPHNPIDLGTKTIKEVKDYISEHPITTNTHQCGVDEYTTVTIKGFALAKISLIKTAKAFGLDVSEPSKIILGDSTDAIGCATKTGDGTLFDKVNSYQMKDTSRYTISGYLSVYLGQPEIVVTSFMWNEKLDVTLDVDKISKDNISITEFYEKAAAVNYNCAGHGYGEVYTIKGLTCYYDESAGQGKDWYNFTDGTQNIRINAYNLGSVSVGSTYDVTGIISLQNLSPIIVAFKIAKSSAEAVDLNEFYKSAKTQSITDLLKIKGSQDDTDTRYPAVVNSYSQISKATGYMCIVEENGKLYVGFSDKYLGENFITGKDNAKANYGVTLIKNDGFWNTTEEKLALFNVYYDVMCEEVPVTIYYVNRQLGYKQNKPMWEILLIPQSIPVPVEK